MCGCEYALESVCRCENPVKCGHIGVHVRVWGGREKKGREMGENMQMCLEILRISDHHNDSIGSG